MLFFFHGIDDVNGSLIHSQDVDGSKDADIRGDDRSGGNTFTVAGNGHVAHNVDENHVFAEEVDGGFGGFGDAFHQFFHGDGPHVIRAFRLVDPFFADFTVRAANADVFVGTAEAAHHVTFEMCQRDHSVIIKHGFTDGHVFEPLSSLDGKECGAFIIGDVNGAEGPAVDFQCLTVFFGRVAVTFVEGVGFDDMGIRQVCFDQVFDPIPRDDVRSVRFAGVEFDGNFAFDRGADALVDFLQSFRGKVTREVND